MPGRIIPYEKIGDELERQLEQLLRVTVLETDKKLKKASPVDTGRFRWQMVNLLQMENMMIFRLKW